MNTETVSATVECSHRSAIKTKWIPNSNRISVSRLDGHCRIYVAWDEDLDTGENHAKAILEFVNRYKWSGVWVIGSTDDGAVAVWKGQE
jgi:hypothetical protein